MTLSISCSTHLQLERCSLSSYGGHRSFLYIQLLPAGLLGSRLRVCRELGGIRTGVVAVGGVEDGDVKALQIVPVYGCACAGELQGPAPASSPARQLLAAAGQQELKGAGARAVLGITCKPRTF